MSNNKRYVVVDIETTGFSATSDRITELGAVKIENGAITEEFSQLIDPGIPIPWRITEITGITSDMVSGKPTIEEAMPHFLEFCAGCDIVAHNARFDMGFIIFNAERLGYDCDFRILDTLSMARKLFPYLENHKLGTVAKHLKIKLVKHHRASDDARATAQIFLHCMEHLGDRKGK